MIKLLGCLSILASVFLIGVVVGMEVRYHDGKLSNMVEAVGVRLNYFFYN